MKVSPQHPFQIVYALFEHQYLGYLFDSFVVALDEVGSFSLKHQNISSLNAKEFSVGLDKTDFELIKLTESMQQHAIIKRFYARRNIHPTEFFEKIYDKQKCDKKLQQTIDEYLDTIRSKILLRLSNKMVFEMGSDGTPTYKQLSMVSEQASILLHVMKNYKETHYFPTIKHNGVKLDFQFKNAMVLCNHPAFLLVGGKIYSFQDNIDGRKLKPFLDKKFIAIPKKIEDTYYSKFISGLIEQFNVNAKGFRIEQMRFKPNALLYFCEFHQLDDLAKSRDEEKQVMFRINFQYKIFDFDGFTGTEASVKMQKVDDSYVFYKVWRDKSFEDEKLAILRDIGLNFKSDGKLLMPKEEAYAIITRKLRLLKEKGFLICQEESSLKKYFLGNAHIQVEIKENKDWFDIHALVKFGTYEIPFTQIRRLIATNKRELTLPDGQIAIIPDAWITQYADFLHFTQIKNNENITLKKHHASLIEEMRLGNLLRVSMSSQLEKLRDFEKIQYFLVSPNFHGKLRSYQQVGYNWLQFLNSYGFGGCLADDMGLGKTVQTLALLQHQKDFYSSCTSLLVVPTSLLHNWQLEAKKFTPQLKIFNYTGTYRNKNIAVFTYYDIVITSYGVVRLDIDILKKYYFNYIILDESQVIKNPNSNIAKNISALRSKNRLILTGTPIENSTMDLWSQLNFINPGLLGTQSFFKCQFQTPIERKRDPDKCKKLRAIVKPFILRRHKSCVATDLPEKSENVQYVQMTCEQEEIYEKTKSFYRNKIMEEIEINGIIKSQFLILQGLTKLRQLANHPAMLDENYRFGSGKMIQTFDMVESVISKQHKILIFSQFVKHLQLFKKQLQSCNIPFAYLDGSTKERQQVVEHFQEDKTVKIFLISLKAGGVGLNLTAADYVFILDPWWNPAVESQAIDRAHRIGQENKVFIYRFITKNSVEEKILTLQRSKRQLARDLISSEQSFIKQLSRQDIAAVLA